MNNSTPKDTLLAPTIIKASAGTGKTYQLTLRYLKLIILGEQPDKILATTFTRKAASEIRDRVLEKFCSVLSSNEQFDEFKLALNVPDLSVDSLRSIFRDFVYKQDKITISTIDSLAAKIATAFSNELGLSDEWEYGTDFEVLKNKVSSLTETIETLDNEIIAKALLSPKSYSNYSINHSAPARTLSNLLSIVEKTFPIYNQCSRDALTNFKFIIPSTSYSCEELALQIQELPIPKTAKGTPSKRWLKPQAKIISLIKENKFIELLSENFFQSGLNNGTFHKQEYPEGWQKACENLRETCLFHITQYIAKISASLQQFFLAYNSQYSKALSESQKYSYEDIKNLISLLEGEEQINDIYLMLDLKFKHILLDEFQDTSTTEWILLSPIIDEIIQRSESDSRSFFCVGDIKQAIYGWRGGEAELFNTIGSFWENTAVSSLTECRRCRPEIVDFVNSLFSNCFKTSSIKDYTEAESTWNKAFAPHTSIKSSGGYVNITQIEPQGELNSPDSDYLEEYSTCPIITHAVEQAVELISNNSETTVAILCRKNSTAEFVCNHLEYLFPEIPYSLSGNRDYVSSNNSFYTFSAESFTTTFSSLVIQLLKLIDNQNDTFAKFQIENSILAEYGSVEKIKESKELIYLEGIQKFLSALITTFRSKIPQSELIDSLELIELSRRFADTCDFRIDEFIKLINSIKEKATDNSRLKVMTIHNSKGLEFDAVILPELDYKITPDTSSFPYLLSRESPTVKYNSMIPTPGKSVVENHPLFSKQYLKQANKNIYESICLLYVAITRAKEALYLVTPAKSKSGTYGKIIKEILVDFAKECNSDELDSSSEDLLSYGKKNWYYQG